MTGCISKVLLDCFWFLEKLSSNRYIDFLRKPEDELILEILTDSWQICYDRYGVLLKFWPWSNACILSIYIRDGIH